MAVVTNAIEAVDPMVLAIQPPDSKSPKRKFYLETALLERGYGPIAFENQSGGTRTVYKSKSPAHDWRAIKLDKPKQQLNKPHVLRHLDRNCNSMAEAEIVAITNSIGIVQLDKMLDTFPVEVDGEKLQANAFEWNDNPTLEDVCKKRDLTAAEFQAIARDLFVAQNALINYKVSSGDGKEIDSGVFHRDCSPRNTFVRTDAAGRIIGAKITDFANMTRIANIKPYSQSRIQTAGSNHLLDPTTVPGFFLDAHNYDVGSEMYGGIGKTLLFAARRTNDFSYDADKKTGVNNLTKTSLLLEDGCVDAKRHEQAVSQSLDLLPKHLSRYRTLLENLLTVNIQKRYKTIDAAQAAFEKATKPTLRERLTKKANLVKASVGLGLASLTTLAGMQYGVFTKDVEQNSFQTIVSPVKLDALSNLVYVKSGLSGKDNDGNFVIYNRETDNPVSLDLNQPFSLNSRLYLKPGANERLDRFNTSLLIVPGRAYIEGFPEQIHLSSFIRDENYVFGIDDDMGGYDGNYPDIKLKRNFAPGGYYLNIEYFAPPRNDEEHLIKQFWDHVVAAKIKNVKPGDLILRERIPIRVGKNSEFVACKFSKDINESEGFRMMEGSGVGLGSYMSDKSFARIYIPELNVNQKSNVRVTQNFSKIPAGKQGQRVLARISHEYEGHERGFSYVELEYAENKELTKDLISHNSIPRYRESTMRWQPVVSDANHYHRILDREAMFRQMVGKGF